MSLNRKNPIRLKKTYAEDSIHREWDLSYRCNRLQKTLDNQIIDRIIDEINPPQDAIFLDAGCGPGQHSIRIAKRGFRCVGVDISETIIQRAKKTAEQSCLFSRVSFICDALEDLELPSDSFDVVHCRGVLMHIPEWQRALANLCRVLKPGGKIVLMEANRTSVGTFLTLLLRQLKKGKSIKTQTPAGIEFWTERSGQPFLFRVADFRYLARQLRTFDIDDIKEFATEFWDINRFPAGIIRNTAIIFNRIWFACRMPAYFSSGVAITGEKKSNGHTS